MFSGLQISPPRIACSGQRVRMFWLGLPSGSESHSDSVPRVTFAPSLISTPRVE